MRYIDSQYRKGYEEAMQEALDSVPVNYYDESALPSYTHANRLINWLFWKRIDIALGLARNIRGGSVLDFGCGAGVTFRFLDSMGCSVAGCDELSADLASRTAMRFGIEAEVVDNIARLDGRKFDFIFALDVLEHIEDPSEYIRRFMELSHVGTTIIISGPTESRLYALGRMIAGFSGDYHESNIYSVESAFVDLGLHKKEAVSLPILFPLFRISSWGF